MSIKVEEKPDISLIILGVISAVIVLSLVIAGEFSYREKVGSFEVVDTYETSIPFASREIHAPNYFSDSIDKEVKVVYLSKEGEELYSENKDSVEEAIEDSKLNGFINYYNLAKIKVVSKGYAKKVHYYEINASLIPQLKNVKTLKEVEALSKIPKDFTVTKPAKIDKSATLKELQSYTYCGIEDCFKNDNYYKGGKVFLYKVDENGKIAKEWRK